MHLHSFEIESINSRCRYQAKIPAELVAQILGHKPSARAEMVNTARPLDLPCVHHEKMGVCILKQAGGTFDHAKVPGKLRMLSGGAV